MILVLVVCCGANIQSPSLDALIFEKGENHAHNWSSPEMEMIVVAFLLAALLGFLFLYPKSPGKGKREGNLQTVVKEKLKTYTKEEVSLHNKRDDCWIVVKDKVYNVTPYVEEHPGGDAILKHAGGDSTEGFYGLQHATRVFDMVDEFYIGDVKL